METRLDHLGGDTHRRVEPMHRAAWPVERPRPFDEVLAATNERQRDADRIDFSDEARLLNAEQHLRDLRCDHTQCSDASGHTSEEQSARPPAPASTLDLPSETTEIVRTLEHRYEVTHRSTTGRLIDMVM